jgi:ABC-type transport system substrate-binding protein
MDICFSRAAVTKVQAVIVIVIVIVAAAALAFTLKPTGVPQPTATSSQAGTEALTLTYESWQTAQYLDPHVSYMGFDLGAVMNNVYEYLLWYNGTSGSDVIPWLAESYTLSSNRQDVDFTLRKGITFQDGEEFNSTAVYFSINRGFIIDGAAPTGYGFGPNWIQQQLADPSLSTVLSGTVQPYSQDWVDRVLGQNFIEITGRYSFIMHLHEYDAAFPYLWTTWGAPVVEPGFVMKQDVALWTTQGYDLPYPALSGDALTMIKQYFYDEVATCGTGPTPSGCGYTYLDNSIEGSKAGTGPYYLDSHDMSTQAIVLQANPNYWGGPYQFAGGQKIVPRLTTVNIKFVPDATTRLIDLRNAAKSGSLMIADLTNDHLYDVADRTQWLDNNTLSSSIQGLSVYGPYTSYIIFAIGFNTNVTNRFTGEYYRFQPFADLRLRLAFADSVNVSDVNVHVNNNLGRVMLNIIPPGLPPEGSFNTSIVPRYHYDLAEAQNLILDAMQHPLTEFTFKNGTRAPAGTFDNTFGCATLNAQNQCDNPVPQTIELAYPIGDGFCEAIDTAIASNINQISATYNLGLSVTLNPMPYGQLGTYAFSGQLYSMGGNNWIADYPWVLDFVGPLLAPQQTWYAIQGYNDAGMMTLFEQAVACSHSGDDACLVRASNQMVERANKQVRSLYEIYPSYFFVMTSNIRGWFFNPSIMMEPGYYFATMY